MPYTANCYSWFKFEFFLFLCYLIEQERRYRRAQAPDVPLDTGLGYFSAYLVVEKSGDLFRGSLLELLLT